MMIDHFLKRNPWNEPVCACGYRPEILDVLGPVGKLWKAKAAVLAHVEAVAQDEAPDAGRIDPESPFRGRRDAKYPRAGVRQMADGSWLLTLWERDRIVPAIFARDRIHSDRYSAVSVGHLTVGACRQSGTNLDGTENP
ncbi:hypothetical protein [Arthrobacter sp. UYCu712]|uniref:hypothetical protein n=1 Tax=Arthrobacter sp. UYCu712 TaxID=3156340 RepID=UPI00339B420A